MTTDFEPLYRMVESYQKDPSEDLRNAIENWIFHRVCEFSLGEIPTGISLLKLYSPPKDIIGLILFFSQFDPKRLNQEAADVLLFLGVMYQDVIPYQQLMDRLHDAGLDASLKSV